MLLSVIVLTAAALALYVAPLLPVIVQLLTKASPTNTGVKAVVLVVLAVISSLVMPVVQNGGSITVDAKFAGTLVVTLLVAIGTHFGVTKPLGITGSKGLIARKVPGGIG